MVRTKQISGIFGVLLDKLLAGKYERRCRFVGVEGLGQRLSNGSYTGRQRVVSNLRFKLTLSILFFPFFTRREIAAKVKQGRFLQVRRRLSEFNISLSLQFYCLPVFVSSKWENLIRNPSEHFIDSTTPTVSDRFHLGLFSSQPKSRNQDSLAFLDHSLLLVGNILIGFLITWSVIFFSQFIQTNFGPTVPGHGLTTLSYPLKIHLRNRISHRMVKLGNYFRDHLRSLLRNYFRGYLPKVLARISKSLNFWFHSGRRRLLNRQNLIFIYFLLFLNINLSILMMNIKSNEVVLDTR